ncbi:streptomycin 6-kinase [Pseudorhizobium tarimense]|uniref:Streptomycin 6-kinase n=1 Tax=Pseudorhizobium tarimense TaxID=1079109 RepID=A0ABV2HDT5_9HYPH|nr:aminoglycoside phosphotransferase family protein [Pseudorhizobium tarimense]MCJ8521695.1 phosphotransferase [Pseudorhizobium tarimense]
MKEPLTGIPEALAVSWGIKGVEPVADTRTSLVHRVWLGDGSSAIVKRLKPAGLHELSGIDFLDWRDGEGCVRLLARQHSICLLEDVGSVTLTSYRRLHGEEASNRVIVSIVEKLHSPSPLSPPGSLLPLRRHFRALLEHPPVADEQLSHTLAFCASLAEELLAAQIDARPLHGDLHHDNIISGATAGWLAIDPQGLVGDPAYDVANIFGNPNGAFTDIVDPRRISNLVDLFAATLGCSRRKVLRHAIAHAGLSICWSLEDDDGISPGSDAAERFEFIKVALPMEEELDVSS